MWNKSEPERNERNQPETPASPVAKRHEPRGEQAIIGPSISIKGDLTGEEDLTIQGRVEGKIDLKQHHVLIGGNGRIKAEVYAKGICIEGEVQGDLHADEQIVVRQSANVTGNITAPRVVLEDGCKFKGSIDMDSKVIEKQFKRNDLVPEVKLAASASEQDRKNLREIKHEIKA